MAYTKADFTFASLLDKQGSKLLRYNINRYDTMAYILEPGPLFVTIDQVKIGSILRLEWEGNVQHYIVTRFYTDPKTKKKTMLFASVVYWHNSDIVVYDTELMPELMLRQTRRGFFEMNDYDFVRIGIWGKLNLTMGTISSNNRA